MTTNVQANNNVQVHNDFDPQKLLRPKPDASYLSDALNLSVIPTTKAWAFINKADDSYLKTAGKVILLGLSIVPTLIAGTITITFSPIIWVASHIQIKYMDMTNQNLTKKAVAFVAATRKQFGTDAMRADLQMAIPNAVETANTNALEAQSRVTALESAGKDWGNVIRSRLENKQLTNEQRETFFRAAVTDLVSQSNATDGLEQAIQFHGNLAIAEVGKNFAISEIKRTGVLDISILDVIVTNYTDKLAPDQRVAPDQRAAQGEKLRNTILDDQEVQRSVLRRKGELATELKSLRSLKGAQEATHDRLLKSEKRIGEIEALLVTTDAQIVTLRNEIGALTQQVTAITDTIPGASHDVMRYLVGNPTQLSQYVALNTQLKAKLDALFGQRTHDADTRQAETEIQNLVNTNGTYTFDWTGGVDFVRDADNNIVSPGKLHEAHTLRAELAVKIAETDNILDTLRAVVNDREHGSDTLRGATQVRADLAATYEVFAGIHADVDRNTITVNNIVEELDLTAAEFLGINPATLTIAQARSESNKLEALIAALTDKSRNVYNLVTAQMTQPELDNFHRNVWIQGERQNVENYGRDQASEAFIWSRDANHANGMMNFLVLAAKKRQSEMAAAATTV